MKHCKYCGAELPSGTPVWYREHNTFCNQSHADAFDMFGQLVGDSDNESNNDRGTIQTPHLPYVGDWGVRRKHD